MAAPMKPRGGRFAALKTKPGATKATAPGAVDADRMADLAALVNRPRKRA